jgi:hypothetical protein
VIRGFHRLEAARRFGLTEIPAVVRQLTEAAARVQGALFDARIGSALTNRDKRELFRRYIKAGGHKAGLPRGQIKTLEEIARDLRYVKPRTIHNWLRKDFPKVADRMSELHPGRPRKELAELNPQDLLNLDPPPPPGTADVEEQGSRRH